MNGDSGFAALRNGQAIKRAQVVTLPFADFRDGILSAVTNGERGAFWRAGSARGHQAACTVTTVDTLAAGDVFHAAFALALAEGRGEDEGMRFASAAAALKCTRFGGIEGAPTRAEVEQLLKGQMAKGGSF